MKRRAFLAGLGLTGAALMLPVDASKDVVIATPAQLEAKIKGTGTAFEAIIPVNGLTWVPFWMEAKYIAAVGARRDASGRHVILTIQGADTPYS